MTADWSAVAALFLIGLSLLFLAVRNSGNLIPALVSYVMHSIIGIGVYVTIGLYSPDAVHYDAVAVELAFDIEFDGTDRGITAGKEGFPLVVAGVYRLIGHTPEAGIILNALLSALVVVAVGGLARRLSAPSTLAAWLAALFPAFMLWGSLLLREAAVWLLLTTFAYGLIGIVRDVGRQSINWLLSLGTLLALFWVRGSLAVILAGTVFAIFIIARGARALVATLLALGLVAILFGGELAGRLSSLAGGYTPQELGELRAALSRSAGQTAFETLEIHDPVSAIISLLDTLPRVLVGPYPWEWQRVGLVLTADAIFWIALLVAGIVGVWRSNDRRRWIVPATIVCALLVVLTVTSGNYGTMQRLRVQAAVLIIPAAAHAVHLARRPTDLVGKASTQPTSTDYP
ncbi:MAG: hypothetical protein ACYC1Z_03265 [Georgenia sp.]